MKPFIQLYIGLWLLLGGFSVFETSSRAAREPELYSLETVTLEGERQTLKPYQGKVVLIVNTASQCGYTKQYAGLENLYTKYRERGLIVLGFPSNDFWGQEPGSNKQIRYFCKSKYSVDFPMFSKGSVSGASAQPLYKWLLKHSPSSEEVGWNFEKFLVSREGKVLGRFKSKIAPDNPQLISAVEQALDAPAPSANRTHGPH